MGDAWLAAKADAPAVLVKVMTEGANHARRAAQAQSASHQG